MPRPSEHGQQVVVDARGSRARGPERRDREVGQEAGRLRGRDDERLARPCPPRRVRRQEPPGRGAQARAQARLARGGLGARAQHALEPVPESLERARIEQREPVGDRLHGRADALERDVQPVGPQAHRERVGGHEPQGRAEGVGLGRAHARPHAGGGRGGAHLADGAGPAVERRERQRRAPHGNPVLVCGDRQIEPWDVYADQHQGGEMLGEHTFDCKRAFRCRCRSCAASPLPPRARSPRSSRSRP